MLAKHITWQPDSLRNWTWSIRYDPYHMDHVTIFHPKSLPKILIHLGKKIVKVACFMWSEGIEITSLGHFRYFFGVHRQINCSKLITLYQTRKFSVFSLPHWDIFDIRWWVLKRTFSWRWTENKYKHIENAEITFRSHESSHIHIFGPKIWTQVFLRYF